MKVKATNAYKQEKVQAEELKRIPEEGEIFEIQDAKFQKLNGDNQYKRVFVELVTESKETEKVKEVKKTAKRNKR